MGALERDRRAYAGRSSDDLTRGSSQRQEGHRGDAINVDRYRVEVTREGRWWMISVPEIDGLTQARRLSEVERMARELIAVTLDLRLSQVAVEVAFGDIDGIPVGSCIQDISSEKAEAARLEEDATAKTKTLVQQLIAHNVPLRDIGAMLGISFQRVHQLAA